MGIEKQGNMIEALLAFNRSPVPLSILSKNNFRFCLFVPQALIIHPLYCIFYRCPDGSLPTSSCFCFGLLGYAALGVIVFSDDNSDQNKRYPFARSVISSVHSVGSNDR
jgi:hypothetical protein